MNLFKRHTPRNLRLFGLFALILAGGLLLTGAAFFVSAVPFWLALVPLVGGIALGTPRARAASLTLFMIWPVAISAIGLVGTGLDVWTVWAGALAILIALATLGAVQTLTGATLLLLLVPVFPASPLLPLADALAPLRYPALWGAGLLVYTAALETLPIRRPALRGLLLGMALAPLVVAHTGLLPGLLRAVSTDAQITASLWQERPVPRTITERSRWIALRDRMPEGSTAVLGENLYDAEDADARAFWCHAARERNLTLFIGVAEHHGGIRRGTIRRLDTQTCAPGYPGPDRTVYRARLGIPGLTGTWGPMSDARSEMLRIPAVTQTPLPSDVGPRISPPDWLICLEAFLPWAWATRLSEEAAGEARPVVILSNDSAFGPYATAMSTLRRKAARAMGRSIGRPVLHAETARVFLLRAPQSGTAP